MSGGMLAYTRMGSVSCFWRRKASGARFTWAAAQRIVAAYRAPVENSFPNYGYQTLYLVRKWQFLPTGATIPATMRWAAAK